LRFATPTHPERVMPSGASAYRFVTPNLWQSWQLVALDEGAGPGPNVQLKVSVTVSDETIDRTKLPIRRPPFNGVANQTLGGSQLDWAQIGHVKPPEGAPNVLVVLIDDAGFGNPAAFGGAIDTPNYERVAGERLRYSSGRITAAIGL
jgi:hypothetical protein